MPDSAMTNIAEEIARIATARNTIRAKAVELGIAQIGRASCRERV